MFSSSRGTCLYTHFHIPIGDYELIFIGHRILFNAVKYANHLISFLFIVWWEIVTFQVDFFFSIWIKILKLQKPSTPSCPYNWGHLTSHLLSSFCLVFGCPSLNCLTGHLMAGECESRLGVSTREGQLHSILLRWNASSPGSGDSILFFPSSGVGEHYLLRWSPLRMNKVGHWGSQALPSNYRPLVVLYFCF